MELTRGPWRKSSYSGANGGDCVEVRAGWRKSSHSGPNGGDCVEVGAGWRKSSRSGANGGECVEVRAVSPVVAVRDSKDPDGPALVMSPGAWRALTGGVKTGRSGRG